MPEVLSQLYPGLARYCPILHSLSPQQMLLLGWTGREVLYGGAVGGGKSAGLLAAALRFVHRPGYRALLLRRTYAELAKGEGLIPLSHEWLGPKKDVRWNEQRKTWTFPSGATIEFGHVQHEEDKHAYQGAAYQFVGFDELTHFTETIYAYIGLSRQRRRRSLSDVPVQTYATANPGGVGHLWVRKRFIDPSPEEHAEADRLFIPAKLRDNPGLDAEEYELRLKQLPPALRAQLADGDWGAFEGAAYEEFVADPDECIHVVPIFTVPPLWERFEFMDHGMANPAAWYICATDHDGNIVVFDSYYSPGLISDHCQAILKRRPAWFPEWVSPHGTVLRHHPHTVADPAVTTRLGTTRKNGTPATIATEYLDQSGEQIVLVPGNNDTIAGKARIQQLLRREPDRPFPEWHPRYGEKGSPQLFIVGQTCPELVEQLAAAPLLPLDSGKQGAGEKVDTDWEGQYGHAHAALRYGVMTRPESTPPVEEVPDDPRTLAFIEYERRRDEEELPRRRATVSV